MADFYLVSAIEFLGRAVGFLAVGDVKTYEQLIAHADEIVWNHDHTEAA